MEFDIKSKVNELTSKLQADPNLMGRFQKDPVRTVEQLLGIDLPDEKLKPLVSGIQTKLAAADLGNKLGGLKNLF